MPLRRDLKLYWWGMAIRISMMWRNTSVGNASYTWHSSGSRRAGFRGRKPYAISYTVVKRDGWASVRLW